MVSDQQLSIDVLLDRISPDNAQPLRQKQTPPTIDNEQTAQQWVANRPEQTSVQAAIDLYQALPQIIDLDIDASSKLAILEAIYPQLIQCTDRLLNTQLNQNTASPADPVHRQTTQYPTQSEYCQSGFSGAGPDQADLSRLQISGNQAWSRRAQ